MSSQVYLASSSPRRQELLTQMGIEFSVVDAEIDETPRVDESAYDFVSRMALEKALAGQQGIQVPNAWVIAGDTAIVFGDQILGKPADKHDAGSILAQLSGSTHRVYSSVAVRFQGHTQIAVNITEVTFTELSTQLIEDYIASGEPMDKAGAYAIQGKAAKWIERINGSYFAVMGLPIFELDKLLQKMNFQQSQN